MSKTFMDHGFPPLSSFRLIVPPLQLVSAALFEIVKQGAVMYYGVLEEFITTVLETAPELLTDTERLQLVIGLRAKVVLELCRNDTEADWQDFQHHLSQMNTYITNQDKKTSNSEVKASVTNFMKLVHTLVEDQCQRNIFFQIIFPTVFGPKYDSALQALMKKFLFNLQDLLPVPSLEQTSLWLSLSPAILKECVDFMNQPQPLKTLIQHNKHHGHKVPQAFSSSGDDCILSSLSCHLPKVDDKCYAQVKSEPICDSQEWQMDNVLDSGSQKGKEEDFKVDYADFESNEEEHGQCVGDVTEDQGASVEVILPSFDETESSDDDHMDKKWFHHLKTGRRTSTKTLKSEGDEDFSCRSKQKEHKMTMSQLGSTSQSCPDPSSLHSTNSELSNDDCSLICHVCDKVFACQKNFEKHRQICADASKRQEDQDPQCSSSLAHHRKPNIVDKTSKSSPCETSHAVTQESKTFHIPQDQTCKRSDRVKQCSICSEIFSCSTDFMKHMKCHAEKNPFLCPDCGIDFESYEGCEKHRKGGCRASSQHVKDYLLSNENKGNQESTLVPSETSQTSTTRDAPKDSKTRKPLLTCQKCGMRFTYCKSFEKHQMKCSSEETSPRKTKKNNLIISGCDSFSADNISERHAEKNCTTIEETPSTVVFKSYEICETQEDGKYRASNQHELDYSWSNENKRNQENTLVSSEICQTSTTADAPADSKGPKPPLTCQECGMCFTYYISFEKHRKKCAKATFQRKTNKNYVTINGCDFLLADGSDESHAEKSLETVEAIPSTEDSKSDDESETHKEDACRASNQYLEDDSMSDDNKRNQENTLVSSETSQTSTTGEAQHSKALKLSLTCQKCGLSFTYCKSFEKHQKKCSNAASQRKTKKNYFLISGCDFFLADDINESHDEKSSETVEINPSTADDAGGSQHKARLFKCSMCEKDFSKIELLKRHYSESHDVRGPYPCTMCKRAFLTLYELVRHQQNKLLFLCPTCKKGFSNIGELKRHERVHTASASITPCTCETCGRSFKFRVNLIRHQRRHRERPPSVCSYCGKQFSSKDGLKAHMVRHTEGYPCPVCGKKFYQKAYLTYHLNRHTGQEKYLCDICGKGWPTVSLLKVHMVKHTEGQPFQCDDCGLTYKRKSGLLAHHRDKHLGLRPFVCEICSKAFRINSQLKKHMTVHTGERPFSCPICGKKFTKSFNLKKHREKPCK